MNQPPLTVEMCGDEASSNFGPRIEKEALPTIGDCVWVADSKDLLEPWVEGVVMDVVKSKKIGGEIKWKVKLNKDYKMTELCKMKIVSGKQMAYWKEATYSLSVGTRCVAIYREDPESEEDDTDGEQVQEAFYPAVIGEKCRESNGFRYLVFYDDGYALYLDKSEVRPVCESPLDVWLDVHHHNKEFIKRYLENWPLRRLVTLEVGWNVQIEQEDGQLKKAKVVKVDCALAGITYHGAGGVMEWIYRGSSSLQNALYSGRIQIPDREDNLDKDVLV